MFIAPNSIYLGISHKFLIHIFDDIPGISNDQIWCISPCGITPFREYMSQAEITPFREYFPKRKYTVPRVILMWKYTITRVYSQAEIHLSACCGNTRIPQYFRGLWKYTFPHVGEIHQSSSISAGCGNTQFRGLGKYTNPQVFPPVVEIHYSAVGIQKYCGKILESDFRVFPHERFIFTKFYIS